MLFSDQRRRKTGSFFVAVWLCQEVRLDVMKRALITGITGQDGSYPAEFLLQKGYEVNGIKRRASLFNTQRWPAAGFVDTKIRS
jgi:hypothetical protein